MAKSPTTVSNHSHAAQTVMARILSTENIRVVVDPSSQTAAFDLKNRTLILPRWKDMSKQCYDMLIGHEISHALHTPAEGWRDTCVSISGTDDTTSSSYRIASLYLNIVEDARIERLIQIKFPGFRRDFIAAYTELNDKNFFGVKGLNLNTLEFPDRINLYYKLGTIGSVGINFTADEDAFIRRIDNATTFADAALIAADLFKFCNQQKHKKQQQQNGNQPSGAPGKSNGNQSSQSQQQSKSNNDQQSSNPNAGDSQQSNNGNRDGDQQSQDGNDPSDQSQDGQGEQSGQGQQSNNDNNSNTAGPVGSSHSHNDLPPTPTTQESFNRNLSQQISQDRFNKDLMAPTELVHCNLSEVIIDCKKIVETARTDAAFLWAPEKPEHDAIRANALTQQTKFMRDSKKQVDLLIKQFELRKAAQIARRESVRKTGILDTVRMVNYKHSEDIFRRNTMLPDGKNHGLVMFVDWSGSMGASLAAVVEQTMVLVEFCRRMQIPYEVFAFTTRTFTEGTDPDSGYGTTDEKIDENIKRMWKGNIGRRYSHTSQEKIMENGVTAPHTHANFSLLNLFSSRHSRTEHQDMLLFMRAIIERDNANRNNYFYLKTSRWELSGTALDESIVAAMQIVPQFKAANKLDIVNTIFLTDGETSVPYINGTQLIDPSTKAVYSNKDYNRGEDYYADHNCSTNILLVALRDITKSNVVGMFLTSNSACISPEKFFPKEMKRRTDMHMVGKSVKDRYAEAHAQRTARAEIALEMKKKFNEDNCVVAEPNTTGYSEYFIVRSTTRVILENDPMDDIKSGATQAAVKKAFLKSFENKNKSRVLINRFMELIAR